jgi:hypothetical protein
MKGKFRSVWIVWFDTNQGASRMDRRFTYQPTKAKFSLIIGRKGSENISVLPSRF